MLRARKGSRKGRNKGKTAWGPTFVMKSHVKSFLLPFFPFIWFLFKLLVTLKTLHRLLQQQKQPLWRSWRRVEEPEDKISRTLHVERIRSDKRNLTRIWNYLHLEFKFIPSISISVKRLISVLLFHPLTLFILFIIITPWDETEMERVRRKDVLRKRMDVSWILAVLRSSVNLSGFWWMLLHQFSWQVFLLASPLAFAVSSLLVCPSVLIHLRFNVSQTNIDHESVFFFTCEGEYGIAIFLEWESIPGLSSLSIPHLFMEEESDSFSLVRS